MAAVAALHSLSSTSDVRYRKEPAPSSCTSDRPHRHPEHYKAAAQAACRWRERIVPCRLQKLIVGEEEEAERVMLLMLLMSGRLHGGTDENERGELSWQLRCWPSA